MVNLGDQVKCKVTGATGVVIGKTEFLHGCTRVGVQAKADKAGKVPDAQWFDEPQLTVTKAGVVKPGNRETGGPLPSIPTRVGNPK